MDLLLTKFHKPHGEGPGCSPRSSLDYGTLPPAWQVLLLSAPAGFGKTSLLGQWMEHCGGETAFLSLDAYDNEPRRFWNYFIASVNRVLPDAGKGVLSLLNTPELPEIENCLIPFINDLHERESGLIMVLDDLHAIEEPAIFRGLDFLLDNLPESVRFIFSTREDPPISLGRLRAKGRLCEIRQHDLRFSEDEACRFLNRGLDAKLSREDCLSLFKRTEGWVTGLQLVKSALRQQKDRAAFIRSFSGSHNYVFDYLLEEVMERLDGETATFLLESSLFDEFSSPLCDDYLVRKTGDSIKRIGRANLFLIPLDDEGIWFRYHHLFLDFLRNRLREGLSGEEIFPRF